MTQQNVPETKNREDLFWIHLIRVIVAFGVILLHVAADVITEWKRVPASWWWAANFYDAIARGCVALFVMVSGALLLPVREPFADFFRKRANRILIPFITWSFIYLFWRIHFYEPNMGLQEALRRLLSTGTCFHLWFLYNLIGVYLITPIFRVWAANAKKHDFFYFLVIWFVVTSLLPTASTLLRILWNINLSVKIPVEGAQGLIGFFVLGHVIRQYSRPEHRRLAWMAWAGGFFFCLLGTFWIVSRTGKFQSVFYENIAPNVVIYACAVFFLLKQAGEKLSKTLRPRALSVIQTMSKATLGIYLIHPMMNDVLVKGRLGFQMKPCTDHPAIMILAVTLIVYFASLCIVGRIRKIPYVRRIV